jgi:thiosulfate/3-mercaptopyruvate sulfurtransferase
MRKEFMMAIVSVLALGGLITVGAYAGHDSYWGRTIDPIVSTDWLQDNLNQEDLIIIDIRSAKEYMAGHIPNSLNEPFLNPFETKWVVSDPNGLWLQLPKKEDLFKTIGDLGIERHSLVVIVTAPNPDEPPFYGLANATRVADTLIYAGVKNVAILDGGYPKWVAESKPTTQDVPQVTPIEYDSKVNKEMFVSIDYVRRRIGRAVIIDARDAEVYFGAAIEPFAPKEGHIPSARCLPTPWMWKLDPNETYTYKDTETLRAMGRGVIGKSKNKEIIVYCGVGGYASSWWFVLTQVLGYENVGVFDGSAQEWVMKGYDMVAFEWE